jgi:hypothetical protein
MHRKQKNESPIWYDGLRLILKKKGAETMATSYEQKVLAWLHTLLIEHDPHIGSGKRRIVVEEVRLEAVEPEAGDSVVILFREIRRPQCLFGFLTRARESSTPGAFEWQRNVWDNPEGEGPQVDADMIAARLREEVEAADIGLPEKCDATGITWI